MQTFKRVAFHTLGCKLNFSESSTFARTFEKNGYKRVSEREIADIYIINSCSVTEHADKKCRNLIRKLHRQNPEAIIAVTGCYAQLKPEDIAQIEGVDLVLSNNDKDSLFERVHSITKKDKVKLYSCQTDEITRFFAAFSSGDRTRSFLKVQDGCDYCCSYCTIHNARGASRNMPIADIVKEAEQIAQFGTKEIVISGINTGDFGKTTGEKFIDLIKALDKVEGIERYRISSIEPNLLTEEIVAFCASSQKFQPHFHIPIQSGSDKILASMRRRYNTEKFKECIDTIRRYMPNAFIGIDVIVGFPDETDEDFQKTYNFLESINPAYLHIFPYSERANTPAIELPNKVKESVKKERAKILNKLCDKLHLKFYEKQIGTQATVLFESRVKGGYMLGYTENYIKVKLLYDATKINHFCQVKLVEVDNNCIMLAQTAE